MRARRYTREGYIHCSATPPDMDIGAEQIRQWHVLDNGWSDIAYHHVIRRDGRLEIGRDIRLEGAHASGQNAHSVAVCLVGGVDAQGRPEDNFTPAQMATLDKVVQFWRAIWPDIAVKGHNQVSNKACPSFDVQEWLARRYEVGDIPLRFQLED